MARSCRGAGEISLARGGLSFQLGIVMLAGLGPRVLGWREDNGSLDDQRAGDFLRACALVAP